MVGISADNPGFDYREDQENGQKNESEASSHASRKLSDNWVYSNGEHSNEPEDRLARL